MPEMPDESKLIELGEKLLVRTHEYCEGAFEDQVIIKNQIDKILARLDKSIDPDQIAKLSTALKTLRDVHSSLHDRAIVGYMAHYKPLKNLIDSIKSQESSRSIDDPGNNHENKDKNKDDGHSLPIINKNPDTEFDLSEIYRKYED